MRLDNETIKHERPPNWDAIVAAFPAVAEKEDVAVFTYFPYVYVPGGLPLTPDLETHERVHLAQQGAYPGEVEVWWDNYLTTPVFRLEQELEAYGAQLAFMKPYGNRVFEYTKDRLAKDLSGPLYGNLISYGEAVSKLRRHARSTDQAAFAPAIK